MMTSSDLLLLAIQAVTFACGIALLSHRFFAAYRDWAGGAFGYAVHLPGILAIGLMILAVVLATSVGWTSAIMVVVAGSAMAYLYVYVLRMRIEAALLGPPLAALLILSEL